MSPPSAMPAPVVLGLAAAVLAAHLWLLHGNWPRRQPAPAIRPPPFVVRSIRPALPPAAPAAPAPRLEDRATDRPPGRPAGRLELPAHSTPRMADTQPVPGRSAAASSAQQPMASETSSAALPARVSIPPSMHLRYQVTARSKQRSTRGTSELAWRQDGASYEARFSTDLPVARARVQDSAGGLGGGGLEPLRFGDRGRGEQAAHFDREQQRVVFSNNRPPTPLAAGAQDRLSVLLQLAALFAGEPGRYPVGASVLIQTATAREADIWAFVVEGEEQLHLPAGDLAAVRLVRPPRGEFDQRVEVWLAPGHAYAPVRLRLTQPNGDWTDHQWSGTDRR